MKKFLLFFVLAFIVVQACKKKVKPGDDPIIQTGELEMKRITKHQWIVYRVDLGGSDVWNNPFLFKACQKDDSYRFYKDSTLVQYENLDVCAGGTDSVASSWQFYDGRKKIIATIIGVTDTVDVVHLQDSLMQFSLDYQGNPALIYFRKK